jgi:hypothetical protein
MSPNNTSKKRNTAHGKVSLIGSQRLFFDELFNGKLVRKKKNEKLSTEK